MKNNQTSTPITLENLRKHGFCQCSSPIIWRKGKLHITCWTGTWQICDEEGRVGNEGNYNSIEELFARAF